MEIKLKMESKWEEITATKNEREALFDNFEANKDRIAELHFEVEIKQLQYMFLKREQLAELKKTAIVPDSVTGIEKVNETCIGLTQKHLIEYGYGERLKQPNLRDNRTVLRKVFGRIFGKKVFTLSKIFFPFLFLFLFPFLFLSPLEGAYMGVLEIF